MEQLQPEWAAAASVASGVIGFLFGRFRRRRAKPALPYATGGPLKPSHITRVWPDGMEVFVPKTFRASKAWKKT